MTEELSGGAPAPAEAPVASAPAPVADSATAPREAEPTPRGAIDGAFAAMEAGDKSTPEKAQQPKSAAPEPTGDRPRNPDGTYAAKAPDSPSDAPDDANKTATEADKAKAPPAATDAPSRFSPDAKAAWATTPEPVKAEVQRALREMESGLEKYRGDAQVYNETFKPFVDLATRSNINPKAQLEQYVAIDTLLARDFNAGIERIFANKGIDPREWAAQITGQAPQEQQPGSQDSRLIAELRQEIASLKQGVNGVHQTVEQQRMASLTSALNQFEASLPDADKSLYKELDTEIAGHLTRDPGITLAEAFSRAKQDAQARYTKMFGSPQPAPVQPPPAADPAAQTRKGQLSITGAPGTGSNPAARKPPSSPRDALDRAFAAVGI